MKYLEKFKLNEAKSTGYDSRSNIDYYAASETSSLVGQGLSRTWLSDLTPEQLELLNWYADDGAYFLANRRGDESVLSRIGAFDKMMSVAFTTVPVIVYRGIRHPDIQKKISSMVVGSTYKLDSYMSTSLHYGLAAQKFTTRENKCLMQISLPRNSNAAYISREDTPNEFESEVLLNTGLTLRLAKIEKTVLVDDGEGEYDQDEIENHPITIFKFVII